MISHKFSRFFDPKLQKTHDLLWESRKRFYAHIRSRIVAQLVESINGIPA
jgi:hypothetical protein